jgi:hypothetical protein
MTGVLAYEPERTKVGKDTPVVFKKEHKVKTLVANLPESELGRYYRWFLKQNYGTWYHLQHPMFGLHVTVVRGDEKPKAPEHWRKHEGRTVQFEYNPTGIRKKWQFWSLPVRGRELEMLRGELGLQEEHDFHITVGRLYEWQVEAQ